VALVGSLDLALCIAVAYRITTRRRLRRAEAPFTSWVGAATPVLTAAVVTGGHAIAPLDELIHQLKVRSEEIRRIPQSSSAIAAAARAAPLGSTGR
jgi:hypothetical protein